MKHLSAAERNVLVLIGVILISGGIARWMAAEDAPIDVDRATPELFAELREGSLEERRRAEIRATPLQPGESVAVDVATVDELQRIPGIGAVTAARIVEWREARGGIGAVEELLEIPGIGERTLERIAPHVHLDRPAFIPPTGSGSSRVDINRADLPTLTGIPGIGPVLAERIIRSRDEEGPFRTVEDLTRVMGIGPAGAARMAPHIEF